jgi:hypothetical protein
MNPVRVPVVLVNIVLLLFLSAADPLICTDGCTDAQHQQSTGASQSGPPAAGACLLCQSGLVPPAFVSGFDSSPVERPFIPEGDGSELSRPLHPIEHPPRFI